MGRLLVADEGVWDLLWPGEPTKWTLRDWLDRLNAGSKSPHSNGDETRFEGSTLCEAELVAGRAPSDCTARSQVSSIRAELGDITPSARPMLDE